MIKWNYKKRTEKKYWHLGEMLPDEGVKGLGGGARSRGRSKWEIIIDWVPPPQTCSIIKFNHFLRTIYNIVLKRMQKTERAKSLLVPSPNLC